MKVFPREKMSKNEKRKKKEKWNKEMCCLFRIVLRTCKIKVKEKSISPKGYYVAGARDETGAAKWRKVPKMQVSKTV